MIQTAPEKTCATCRHWHPHPRDPNNLGAPPQGLCREGPPGVIAIQMPAQHGPTILGQQQVQLQYQLQALYPTLPEAFPACGRHEERKQAEAAVKLARAA